VDKSNATSNAAGAALVSSVKGNFAGQSGIILRATITDANGSLHRVDDDIQVVAELFADIRTRS
jgi:hypothetical protein